MINIIITPDQRLHVALFARRSASAMLSQSWPPQHCSARAKRTCARLFTMLVARFALGSVSALPALFHFSFLWCCIVGFRIEGFFGDDADDASDDDVEC